jgi:4-hydroxybenzoate polyprenyltransferase
VFSLVCIAVGLAVTWFRSKTGAYLMIIVIVLGSIDINIYTDRFLPFLVYTPFLISGILLLWFAYIKKEDQAV